MKHSAAFLLLSAALLIGGCGSAPRERYYSMAPAPTAAPAGAASVVTRRVVVGPVSVPESINRVEIVVRRGEHRLELLEMQRWAAPPASEVANATAQALEAALAQPGTRVVVDGATIGPAAAQRVVIDVQRFDAVLGQRLAFEASWRVLDAKGAQLASGQTRVIEPATADASGGLNGEAEAIAAAAGRAVAQMARQIALAMPPLPRS
jgi:uncharacterized protein